jgi:hypothetical protein
MTPRSVLAAAALASALAGAQAVAQPGFATDPSLAGFPPGYIQDCRTRPSNIVTTVPAPFNAYMRVVCTKVSDALAPLPGYSWQFTNGTGGFLTAINPKTAPGATPPGFTRLANAALTAAEVAAFRQRLQRLAPVAKDPAILAADVLRLEVDTSSADHKQEYFLVAHSAAGAVAGEWGIECYNDCNPMEASPWAFTVVPVAK